MANIVKILWSRITGRVPATLVDGQIAINGKDRTLFYPDENNVVRSMSLVPAAGGSVAITTVEKNLGLPATNGGMFTITGLAGLTPTKQVIITQAAGPYTGKGSLEDEAEMDSITAKAFVVDASTIKVFWMSDALVTGNYKFNYFIQP